MHKEEFGELLARCADRCDAAAWDEFLLRFEGRLAAGIEGVLRRYEVRLSRESRQDLLQEVYCRLLDSGRRCLRSFRGDSEGAAVVYLKRISESVVIDFLRNRSARKRGRALRVEVDLDWQERLLQTVEDPRGGADSELLRREHRNRVVAHCCDLLGVESRSRELQVFCLAFLVGLSSREISEWLAGALSPGGVDCAIHRIKRRLLERGVELPRRSSGPRNPQERKNRRGGPLS